MCVSPTVPGFNEAYGLMSALPYGFMACSPVILERLGPHILRSHVSTAQYKPIPHSKQHHVKIVDKVKEALPVMLILKAVTS